MLTKNWLFLQFLSTTIAYLCKLIECNKTTYIVNRCLQENYRETFFFLFKALVRYEFQTKRKMQKIHHSIFYLSFFDFVYFIRSFVHSIFPCFQIQVQFLCCHLVYHFFTLQCSFSSLDIGNETKTLLNVNMGLSMFHSKIPFSVTVDFHPHRSLRIQCCRTVLQMVFVDKCDMLTRLTLKWIQIRKRALLVQ